MTVPIQLTEAAKEHLIDLLELAGEKAVLLRVNSKGCGGHSYQMNFVHSDLGDEFIALDDRHRLIVDQRSLLWIIGTTIDYEISALETNLVFRNPMEQGKCGCGMSFTINDQPPCGY